MSVEIVLSLSVGILSILVVILIGWNIYTIIDSKSIIKEIQQKNSTFALDFKTEANILSTNIYKALAEFYRKDGTQIFEYFHYSLLELKYCKDCNEIGACDAKIRLMIEAFPTGKISTFNKALLIVDMNRIIDDKSLRELSTLKSLILKIPVDF